MSDLTMVEIYRPENIDDPYPMYRRIRETDPVFWDDRMGDDGAWMVTGHQAALAALMDPRMSAKRPRWSPQRLPGDVSSRLATAQHALDQQVVTSDPPAHTRIRQQMTGPFLPRPVAAMREALEKLAHRLLDHALGSAEGEWDAMESFAFAMPAASLTRMLGIPARDERYLSWMLSLGLLIDDGPLSRQHQTKLLAGVAEYTEFFAGHVLARRDGGYDDLLQALADSYAGGGFDNEPELLGNLAFLLTAGQISTAHQIGNTLLHLLRDPDLYRRISADLDRLAEVTPEFMRYDASIQLTKRRVCEPLELGGHLLNVGDEVFVWIGAAHRDPDRYPDPDRLDPDRSGVRHLAFGHGVHYCLGSRLGQLVHDVAVTAFLERVPRPRLRDSTVERSVMPTFRGPYRLPVRFG